MWKKGVHLKYILYFHTFYHYNKIIRHFCYWLVRFHNWIYNIPCFSYKFTSILLNFSEFFSVNWYYISPLQTWQYYSYLIRWFHIIMWLIEFDKLGVNHLLISLFLISYCFVFSKSFGLRLYENIIYYRLRPAIVKWSNGVLSRNYLIYL